MDTTTAMILVEGMGHSCELTNSVFSYNTCNVALCYIAVLLHVMKRFILITFPKILNGFSGTFDFFQNLETVELDNIIYYAMFW